MQAQAGMLGVGSHREACGSNCIGPKGGNHMPPPPLPTFAEVVDLAPDAVFLIDVSGSIVYANRCVMHQFGVEPAAILGQAIETLIPECYRAWHAAHWQAYDRALRKRPMGDVHMTLMGRHSDGHEFPVDVHLAPMERAGQRWTLAVVRDATEQHHILSEVRAARRAAEEVARVKGEFLGFAAHDLSQPVQTLELLINAMEPRVRQCPDIAKLSALATISLARMRELLKMLLEISRIESGTLQIHEQPVQIAEIFEYLDRQFGPLARAKALAFVTEPCAHIVNADPALLRGMLSNLVANAIRYTPRGEVRLHSTLNADGRLHLAVRDTGIGIPSEHLQTIFEDFRRLETAEHTAADGFGLGLGIVRRISTLLGFPISVQSTVGLGSTFSIEIPPAKFFCVA